MAEKPISQSHKPSIPQPKGGQSAAAASAAPQKPSPPNNVIEKRSKDGLKYFGPEIQEP
jgi:hypothetical protein